MSEKQGTTGSTTTTTTVTHTETSTGNLWEKYSKPLLYGAGAIILAVAAWIGYREMVQKPAEQKASDAIFMAENLFSKMAATSFNKDSSVIVLNGGNLENDKVTGVLKVISSHGGTAAANRAEYIAGATYLHLKEFDKAIKHLKNFKANGAHQLESKAYLMLGHAYAELEKTSEALEHYKKAAAVNKKDESVTPEALFMAATYADAINKTEDAKKLYKELKDGFPAYNAVRSGDVDKYLARLGELK